MGPGHLIEKHWVNQNIYTNAHFILLLKHKYAYIRNGSYLTWELCTVVLNAIIAVVLLL